MSTPFSEKLQTAMDKRDLSNYKLSKLSGVAQSTIGRWLKGNSEPQAAQVKAIADAMEVNPDWLLSDASNLDYNRDQEKTEAQEPDNNNLYPVLNNKSGVPYYDVDFVGGFDLVFNEQQMNPSFYISYAPYNNADAWVNVTGKSMSPFISHGDIAAFKKLNNWRDFFPLGEIYAIITSEHRTIKIVTAGKDENHLTLVPYNKSREFVEQQIHKDLILQMYKVMGSIKKFF